MPYEFAQFSIRNYRNYGVRVTSRTEGSHGVLKRFIKTRNSTLRDLYKAIKEVLDRLRAKYESKLQEETTKR